MLNDVLTEIESIALDAVTGGRLDAGPQTASPQMTQALTQASQAFQQGMQTLAQAKQGEGQGLQQVIGQLAQQKMGGGGHDHG